MTRPYAAALIAQRDRIANRDPVPPQGDRTMTTQFDMVQAAASRRIQASAPNISAAEIARHVNDMAERSKQPLEHALSAAIDHLVGAIRAERRARDARDVAQDAREAGL